MKENYTPPTLHLDAFNCAHCGAYSEQKWTELHVQHHFTSGRNYHPDSHVSCCHKCEDITIWIEGNMVYPSAGSAPPPNQDMPDEIKKDYNEARDICLRSPRSACILLRLCIEKICQAKDAKGTNLDEMIGYLVNEQRLDTTIQKALDSIRVIGGQAAHTLQMDLRDDIGIATNLFKIVNYITDWAYTRKNKIDDIFDGLPENKKSAIERRTQKYSDLTEKLF